MAEIPLNLDQRWFKVSTIGVGTPGERIIAHLLNNNKLVANRDSLGIFNTGQGVVADPLPEDVINTLATLSIRPTEGEAYFINVGGGKSVPKTAAMAEWMCSEWSGGDLGAATLFIFSAAGGTGMGASPVLAEISARKRRTETRVGFCILTENDAGLAGRVNQYYGLPYLNSANLQLGSVDVPLFNFLILFENDAAESLAKTYRIGAHIESVYDVVNSYVSGVVDLVFSTHKAQDPGPVDLGDMSNMWAGSRRFDSVRYTIPFIWPPDGRLIKPDRALAFYVNEALENGGLCRGADASTGSMAVLIAEGPMDYLRENKDAVRTLLNSRLSNDSEYGTTDIRTYLIPEGAIDSEETGLRLCILVYGAKCDFLERMFPRGVEQGDSLVKRRDVEQIHKSWRAGVDALKAARSVIEDNAENAGLSESEASKLGQVWDTQVDNNLKPIFDIDMYAAAVEFRNQLTF